MFTGIITRLLTPGNGSNRRRNPPNHGLKPRGLRRVQTVNERYHNQDCKEYNDFREVLARPDIDAVLIGTPDHWHALIAIEACKHGKDVYCEKPECLTIKEGRAMVQAVHRYGRVFSGGRPARAAVITATGPGWSAAGRWERSRRSSAIAGGTVGRLLPRAAIDSAWRRLGDVAGTGGVAALSR